MAQFLSRLGAWSVRRRRLVVGIWVVALALAGVGAATLAGDTNDVFELPGTESQEAIDQLAAKLPGAGGATARVVFETPEGESITDPTYQTAIADTVAALTDAPGVVNATDPFESQTISPDGRIAFSNVAYAEPAAELSEDAKAALESAPDAAVEAGLTVEFGGDALAEEPHAGAAEIIGLIAAIVVLLFTFGSVVAAGLPILTALIGVAIGILGITAATGLTEMSSTAPTLAIMLGLAVGIDYALFIVTRHRQLVAEGATPSDAAARAVGTAGSAVVFAGATVVIALLGLFVVGIPFLTVMGVAAAATVTICVLIAITLLPALLGFAGQTIDKVRVPGIRVHTGLGSSKDALGLRWGRFVVRRAKPLLAVSLLGVGLFAIPASQIEMGLLDDGSASVEMTQRRAYDTLARGFGEGFNGPLIVVVDTSSAGDPAAAVAAVRGAIEPLDNAVRVAPAGASEDGSLTLLSVIPGTGPSAPETADLVDDIRAAVDPVEADLGTTVGVTGAAALNIDITAKLGEALPIYALVVVGLALVLLMMVFRSVLVPIKAAIGFLLSVVVSFGATVAVFQWGWLAGLIGLEETGPIISILPILLLGILFGLAMDYEVFLVSRIREDFVHGMDAESAIIAGVRHSSRVIVAAGLIMIAVFGAFVLGADPTIKMIGLALATGVLADAFVVRMTMVPAVLALLGDRAWSLPGWLDRILPNIDVEGSSLDADLETSPGADPAATPATATPASASVGAR
ncbi:MAG: MMPL family transporter [Actinobacteria bacterium]|nr:MMPL family transporter [Actinomycetota bacterium]